MNSANQPPAPHRPTDDQLEERIVAWVLGEASDFEIAALQAAVAARPELAAFKRRIEAVHGLVGEAARPDTKPLRLSPDRRAKLLAVIGSASAVAVGAVPGKAATQPRRSVSANTKVLPMSGLTKAKKKDRQWLFAIAACFVVVGMLATLAIPSFQKVRMAAPEALARKEERMAATERHAQEMSELDRDTQRAKAEAEVAQLRTQAETSAVRRKDSVRYGDASPPVPATLNYDNRTTDEGTTGMMEPFEVNEEMSVGYTASNTLTGTRIRTQLHDIGSAISVVSSDFLKDVGATDSRTMLEYGAKKEVGGVHGNFRSKRKRGLPVPSSPVALGGEQPAIAEEEIVVLSPFEVTQDKSFLRDNRPTKKPKRRGPSATSAGMAVGGLDQNQVLLPAASTASTPSTQSTANSDGPLPRPAQKPLPPPTADETSAAQEPVSTFSLHVSDASFKLALAALAAGRVPDAASIRPEEFYNAFDYGDPAPGAGEKVSCRVEQAAHPFAQQRNLVRIAVRVPATGRGSGTPLNLIVLLDTSGSMERPDRRAAVRAALSTLVGLLGPNDHVTLVGFARQPRLLAEALDSAHANQLLDLLDRTPAEGGTNLEEALKLGGELARRHFSATAQNRIVLLTDGAANLGNAGPERLAAAIETLRSQRIAFDACGVGLEGVEDEMLEALTRKGDGRYYVLDSPEAADAGFARQLAGAFRPAAENVKLQVRFNPARVGRYRLVGFEKHRLREEDFRNDAVDAAEISSEEAAVAVYEIEALPQGEGELGEVFVRFRDAAARTMVEHSWTLPYEARAAAFDRASPGLQLAGTAASLAEKLRGGPAGDRVDLDTLAPIVNAQRARRPNDKRIQDLATMFEQMRRTKR
ncbi:MAG TPA: von Willebrand factor type A domain-containing protein [Opitutaceae bacterium]|nr:von Willebrand factor type A domain-containing protein [Opitutaceae bacterium]